MGVQPERLAFGDTIGPKLHWVSYNDYTSFAPDGPMEWNVNYYNNFMGFRVKNAAETLYGWIRLNTFGSSTIEIYDAVIDKKKSLSGK